MSNLEENQQINQRMGVGSKVHFLGYGVNTEGTTVSFFREAEQITITYDWAKQESCIYVNGERVITVPLQTHPAILRQASADWFANAQPWTTEPTPPQE